MLTSCAIAPLELKYEDASKYPKKYQRVTLAAGAPSVSEVDKNLLREQIKNGVDVSKWCSLGEKSTYLSIR